MSTATSSTTGILGRLGAIFGGIFRRKSKKSGVLAVKISEIRLNLQLIKEKLEEVLERLKKRNEELFSKAIRAHLNNDSTRAAMYAAEIAEIRKMAKTLLTVSLALERVILRLETVETFEEAGLTLVPALKLLTVVKDYIAALIPDISIRIDESLSLMNEVIALSGTIPARTMDFTGMNKEVEEILEQSAIAAEKKLRESFPEPPKDIEKPIFITRKAKTLEELILKQATPRVRNVKKIALDELEEKILDYIRTHRGYLDISDCARIYGVNKEDVLKALESLKRKGKIKIKV